MKSSRCCSLVLAAAVAVLSANPGATIPLPLALDNNLTWRTGGEAPWFGSALVSHDGVDAARSGGGGAGESWLETDATGPGALAFWVKSETAETRLLLNDTALAEPSGEWTRRALRLGPGAQRVRFAALYNTQSTSGADAMFVDEVNFTPSAAVSLGEAADATALTWSGSAGAFGFSEAGGDFIVVQARGMVPGEVTANVTGPAAVRFRWKMTGYGAEAKFTASVSAAVQEWRVPEDPANTSRGEEAWFDAEVLVPAGVQSVVWVPDAGGDFLLDAVTVTSAPSAGAAVGQPGLTWSGEWLTRPAAQALGGAVVVTRVVVPEQESVLTTTITGPAEVTYVSSLLSATGSNPLVPAGAVPVRVDGAEGTARSTALADGWQRTTIFVPEGAHTVAWVVANPPTPFWRSPQSLQGVLDDVQITPLAPASLAEALKTTLAPQVTEGAALSGRWRGMKSLTSGLNGSAVVCGPLAEGEATTLTLPVTGPARLLFSVRCERWQWDRQGKLTAQLDGADVLPADAVTGPPGATIPPLPPADWRTLVISLPTGAHTLTLTLRAAEAAPAALLWLDAVGYLPADPGASKIAAGVEMPGTQWRRISPRGRGAWRILATPMAREGTSLAACMDVPAGQSASLETILTGPGTLAFSWGQAVDGTLKVFVNDMEAAQAWSAFSSETPSGERVDLVLPPGPQTVRWTYTQARPPTPSPAAAQAWLDAVKFTPLAAGSPPGPGLDVTAPVTTDNDWPWHTAAPSFSATGDGDAAMVEVPAAGSAGLEMPLTGPGRFAFWWRAETEYLSSNAIALAVDDIATAWLPSANNWYRSEFTVGPGAHRLRWLVGPSGGSLRREDVRRVWLDGFTQLPTLPLAAALDNSLTWTTGAPSAEGDFTDWIGLPAAETAGNPGTDDAAVTLGTRPLTTQVTGPGVVTFRWAEKSVPPLPVVEAPPLPPAPGSPMVLGGGTLGLVKIGAGFWNWNWWYQPPPPRAIFAVNGAPRATLDLAESGADTGFNTHSIHVGPGTHTLTWQRPARSDGRRLVVESVSFTPQPDVFAPVAAELGVPVAALTMNAAPWTVQNTQTHDGIAALQSPAGGGSTIELEFTGPGELSFWWKATGSADFRDITNGETIGSGWLVSTVTGYTAPMEWQRFTRIVSAGTHRFSWRAHMNGTLWLDEVTFSTPQPLAGPNAVAEALDFSGLTWNAPGWQPMTGGGLGETRDALAGPEYGGAEDPWLETTMTGPATLSFAWWREIFPPTEVSAPAGPVKFLLDGVETAIVAGSGRVEAAVPAGSHTLRFIFQSTTAQHRRPVMDDVRLSVPVAAALDQPALTWTSDSATLPWRGWQSDRYAGHGTWVDAPVNAAGVPAGGTLSTVMTGPAMVAFEVLFPLPADTRGLGGASQETLLLSVDGVERWRASLTTEGWQTVAAFIGPGTHTVSWRAAAGFASKVDNCVITPDAAPQPTLAEAVDTPGRAFFGDPQYLPADWTPVRHAATGAHDDAALAFYNSARPSSLGTFVEGPAWVTFDYRSVGLALKVITDDGLRYTLEPDYIYSGYPPPAPVWKTATRVFIPAGSHQCLWQTGNRLAAAPVPWVQVDAITITPLYSAPREVPLAEALDAPGLTFTNSGVATWSGRSVAGATGGDAATVIATSANAELNTTVTGPGTLVWRWKVERFGTYWSGYPPSLSLLLNGTYKVSQGHITPAEWFTGEWPVPPGEHEVRWFLRSPYDNSIAWLDDVRFIAAPTLAEALDLPAAGVTVNVENGAPAPVTLRDGSDAVFLDAATGNYPVLSATVTGPGELAFDWKNTLPSDSHARMVTVDGQPAGDWYPPYAPGTYNYATTRAFIAVGPGEHVIRWHANFTNGSDGEGLWLDRFTWSAGVPAWAQAAGGIGANGITAWITGGVPAWSAAAGAGLNNTAAAANAGSGWLTAIVPPGPGTLCWWGRTTSANGLNTGPGLTGPGTPAFFSNEWRFLRASRSHGQPLPLWRTGTEAFVTGANFTPAVTVPLPQALDAPAVVFETSPDAPWAGVVADNAPLGTSAARSGYDIGNEGSWVRATFTGPGRLNYSWRFQRGVAGVRSPRIRVSVDTFDTDLSSTSGPSWRAESVWLEAGAHTVTWRLWAGVEGDDLWLDSVAFTPAVPVSLATALDYTGAPWTTGGTGTWSGLSSIPDTSGDGAAISPLLGANEEAWLETTVPGSGVLTWRWRLIPGGNPAEFEFLLDGLPLTSLTQTEVWQTDRWELPSGPHTLRWRYKAPWAEDRGAMLDGVSFTPAPPPAWHAALGAQTVPLGGGGVTPWNVTIEEGVAFLRNSLPHSSDGTLIYGSSGLFADITGPAVVTWDARLSAGYTLWLDGDVEVFNFSPEWRNSRLLVAAGRHRLRWELLPSGTNRQVDLRQLTVTPISPVPLTDAVEATGLTVVNDATNPWIGIREAGRPSDDDYAAVLVPPLTGRALEVEFTGPGVLRSAWDWPAEDFNTGAGLLLTEGAVELQRFSMMFGENHWSTVWQFGPGVHRVKFGVYAWYQFFEPHLNSLHFEQSPVVDIATAIGTPGRTFTTGGEGWVSGLVRPDLAPQGDSVVWLQARPSETAWLETEITGPAEVSFWWRISAPNWVSRLVVLMDETNVRELSADATGEGTGTALVRVNSGTHRLRWRWERDGNWVEGTLLNAALLDRLTITPHTPVALNEAADAPSLTFTPQAGDWNGWRSADAVTGGDFIEVSRSDGTTARLDVSLTGPGILRWSWTKARPGWPMPMSAVLQGRVMAEYTDYGGWKAGFIAVPPGAQTVTFALGETGGPAGVLGQLDNFTWQPTSAGLTAAAAVEASGLTNIAPVTPGDWFPLESPAHSSDGTDALVAGVPGREHRLRANATGPGTLSYVTNAHVVGTASNFATVRLLSDGIQSTPITLQSAGTVPAYRVLHFTGSNAAHTFEWVQDWQAFYRSEYDYAWLDQLTFTPAAPAPLAVAVDQPAWTFTTGGPVPWQGATSPGGVNGSLAYTLLNSAAPNAPESWLETTITGPGLLYGDLKTPPGMSHIYRNGTLISIYMPITLDSGANVIRWAVRQSGPATDATVTLDNLEWLPTTWTGWQALHFPAGTPAAVSDVTADPDNDGRPNGLEAWLGSSPLRADTAPPLSITPHRFPYLTFDTVFAPPHGITLAIEIAADPAGPWSTVCESTAPDPWSGPCYYDPPPARARERRYFYAGSEAARFYRLRVSK